VPKNRMIGVKEKEVTFGKPSSFPSFGWDVDYGTISVRYWLCSFNQINVWLWSKLIQSSGRSKISKRGGPRSIDVPRGMVQRGVFSPPHKIAFIQLLVHSGNLGAFCPVQLE